MKSTFSETCLMKVRPIKVYRQKRRVCNYLDYNLFYDTNRNGPSTLLFFVKFRKNLLSLGTSVVDVANPKPVSNSINQLPEGGGTDM